MGSFLEHLQLTEWPFAVVPRPEFCNFIAGRPTLREDLTFLAQSLGRRDTSSIHVLWSWLGAGKTHALYYLGNEASELPSDQYPVRLIPIYSELPRQPESFLDVYRELLPQIPQKEVIDAFFETSTEPLHEEILQSSPDLAAALRVMAIDDDPQRRATAMRWLRGDKLPPSEFRKIGISERLDSTDRAVKVLGYLLRLLREASKLKGFHGIRVIWMLDEFQRLERAGRRAISDINTGLQSLFNLSPVGLSIIISFSGAPKEKTLPSCFTPELRDRIGTTKVLVLPPLQPSEALNFVKEVLARFRPTGSKCGAYFPFEESACKQIISFLSSQTDLRPRAVMHAFNAVLEAADPAIQANRINTINSAFVDQVLAQYVVLSDASDENA